MFFSQSILHFLVYRNACGFAVSSNFRISPGLRRSNMRWEEQIGSQKSRRRCVRKCGPLHCRMWSSTPNILDVNIFLWQNLDVKVVKENSPEQWKKPLVVYCIFAVWRGWKTAQLYGDCHKPLLTNQPVFVVHLDFRKSDSDRYNVYVYTIYSIIIYNCQ